MCSPPGHCQFVEKEGLNLTGWEHDAREQRVLSMRVWEFFRGKSVRRKGCCWLSLRGIRRNRSAGLGKQFLCRLLSELQNPVRKNAEIQGGSNADRERDSQSKWDRSDGDEFARFPHVHYHQNAQIIVGPDGAIEDAYERK